MTPKAGKTRQSGSKGSGGHKRRPGGRQGPRLPGLRLWDMLTLADQTDENGRLLLEDSAPKAAIAKADRAGIPRKTRIAPYADTPSRQSGLMNESAYEALRRDTADILSGFAWLAANYLEMYPDRKGSVAMLVDVSHLGLTLPLVLIGRARSPLPAHGHMPSYVASIFKASRGVFSAAVDMADKKGSRSVVTAAEVTRFADEEGHFRRAETERVCAAPTRLIERTLAVMLTGEGAEAGRTGLAELIEFKPLWDFYCIEAGVNEALSHFGFVLNNLMGAAGADPQALFDLMVPEGERLLTFGELTEETLRRANAAQASLNQLLGRSRDAARITFNDLVRLI